MKQINNADLTTAFHYGLLEANKWKQCVILLNKKGLEMQKCVISLLASELFLKSILMYRGINITTIKISKNGHELYKFFRALPIADQTAIEKNIEFKKIIHVDMLTGALIKEYNNFDEAVMRNDERLEFELSAGKKWQINYFYQLIQLKLI